jgi:hypothetical protein
MLRKSFCIAWLLLGSITLMAQFDNVDTHFRADRLLFFSPLEKKSMVNFMHGDPDYLAMIAAVNPGTSERELELYRDWIDEIISEIRSSKFEKLGNENRIARIRKYVSRSLLLNYNSNANFDNLFRDGDYNYFTAASLYAFILDQLGIPYEIREKPTNIYLVAYPGTDRISIETTKPGFQFIVFDFDTRENFINFIHGQGVIDDKTYNNGNRKDLFQQYYFADYGLGIREMIGMLYFNSAVDLTEKGRQDDAYAQMEKAFILYPCYKTQFMLLANLNNFIRNMDFHNLAQLGYLIKASRLTGHGVDRKLLLGNLNAIVDKMLVRDEDPEGFKFIYDYLMEYLEDEDLKKDFRYRYLYQSGRMEFLNARYAKALEYLEPAYLIHPEDEATQDILARSFGGYALMNSPRLILDKIQHYDSVFTGVTDEGVYLMAKMQTYLELFGQAFQLQDRETGEKYRLLFENLMDENPDAGMDQYLIGRSYSSAAIFYYRRGQISKSEQLVRKGLEYAPDNIDLKLKMATFR